MHAELVLFQHSAAWQSLVYIIALRCADEHLHPSVDLLSSFPPSPMKSPMSTVQVVAFSRDGYTTWRLGPFGVEKVGVLTPYSFCTSGNRCAMLSLSGRT